MRACRIGRADIEESKSGIALNAPPPQASYPCGNFSGISTVDTNYAYNRIIRIYVYDGGSLGRAFTRRIEVSHEYD